MGGTTKNYHHKNEIPVPSLLYFLSPYTMSVFLSYFSLYHTHKFPCVPVFTSTKKATKCQRLEGGKGVKTVKRQDKEFQGWWNKSVWYCDRNMTQCICQTSTTIYDNEWILKKSAKMLEEPRIEYSLTNIL